MLLSALAGAAIYGCATRPAERSAATAPTAQPLPLDDALALIDARDDWRRFPEISIPRHPAEKYLAGLTLVIDPGHGGTDGGEADTRPTYKAGPTGVKEAHMNLRVALLLERLLADTGARVLLTRRGDDTISLPDRAEIANTAPRPDGGIGADLFISIHHNATSSPTTNWPSVWYHAEVDDAEVALDAGRYIAWHLGQQMRTDAGVTSPLLSDQLMYANGFGVLRACKVPGILLESSFFSNPEEEQRLRDAGYNLREAYAIYLGLVQWAQLGRPGQSAPVASVSGNTLRLSLSLDEGLPDWWGADRNRTLRSTLRLTLDGRPMAVRYDPRTQQVTGEISLPRSVSASESRHVFDIRHQNKYKNSNFPQRYELRLARGANGRVRVRSIEPLSVVRAGRDDVLLPARPTTRPATRPATRPTLASVEP